MHVLYLNARYAPEGIAGPAFSTQFLAEQLVREGGRATVVCRTAGTGLTQEVLAGVRVLRVGLRAPENLLFETIGGILDRDPPDVVHTLFPREFPVDPLSAAIAGRGIPLVHTILAFNLLCARGSLMKDGAICTTQCADCRAATAGQRCFAARVAAVAAVSRYMLDLHLRWGLFADTPIRRIIRNTYRPPHPVAPSPAGRPLRLGYLGRLDPLKGIDLLLRTLTTQLAGRDWTLVLAGSGDPAYEQSLRGGCADPRVRFLGFTSQTELLSQVDVLVVPSLIDEPFGRVVFEAYAHAVPVIGSRRGGIPEGIADGVTGLLFEPERHDGPGSLEHAITTLLDDPGRVAEMKVAALAKWESDFRPEVTLAAYREIYAAVCRH